MGSPAYYKDNPATRAFERVQELRSQMGSRADRGLPPASEDVGVPQDMRNVPIGEDGNPLPMISPLSPEQIAARNAAWERETGQRLDSLNNVIQAGAAGPDEEDIPAYDPGEPAQRAPIAANGGTYRWPSIPPAYSNVPRHIDFAKMQSINPTEGVVVVDGITFTMNASEKQTAAVLLANVCQRAMQEQILAGLKTLGLVETANAPQDVAVPPVFEEGAEPHTSSAEVLP
jgi:hypothetical protein